MKWYILVFQTFVEFLSCLGMRCYMSLYGDMVLKLTYMVLLIHSLGYLTEKRVLPGTKIVGLSILYCHISTQHSNRQILCHLFIDFFTVWMCWYVWELVSNKSQCVDHTIRWLVRASNFIYCLLLQLLTLSGQEWEKYCVVFVLSDIPTHGENGASSRHKTRFASTGLFHSKWTRLGDTCTWQSKE